MKACWPTCLTGLYSYEIHVALSEGYKIFQPKF